jgi:hypothetical protein
MAALDGWDDAFYLAQLTSAVGDGDLMLQDDLLALGNPLPMRFRALTTILDSGALQNTFSVGPALLHAAYIWPVLVGRTWPDLDVLRVLLAFGSMAALVALVRLSAACAQRLGAGPVASRVAAVLAVVASPLALYGTRYYLGSHLLSALWAALLLWSACAWLEEPKARYALALGLATGLLVVTRWQDALVAAGVGPALGASLVTAPPAERRARAGHLALALVPVGLAVAVQALAWRVQYGVPFLLPQGGGYMDWHRPHLWAFLFSTYHGLLPWAPGLAVGVAAFAWARGRFAAGVDRALRLGLLGAAAAAVYASASVSDWWGGESYGPRRLCVLVPLAACGLAALLGRLSRPGRAALVAGLAAWAAFTATAYVSGYDDLRVAFGSAPDPRSPVGAAAYDGARWIDRPGTWPKLLRPGFTLTDRPTHGDRLLGAVATALLFLALNAAWRRAAGSAALQRALVAAGLVWLSVAALWMARLPSNARWNAAWRDTVAGRPPTGPEASPPGLAAAGAVVTAAHALHVGDREAARRALSSVDGATLRVSQGGLATYLEGADGRRRLDSLRAGHRIVLP